MAQLSGPIANVFSATSLVLVSNAPSSRAGHAVRVEQVDFLQTAPVLFSVCVALGRVIPEHALYPDSIFAKLSFCFFLS